MDSPDSDLRAGIDGASRDGREPDYRSNFRDLLPGAELFPDSDLASRKSQLLGVCCSFSGVCRRLN
ncbi:hypothetical protein [Synechococcus sp. M16CYN]|uniref:hypothetical protein n=1 Tax=Synechococcus sp. M16CYN TaxID=3103139 RepID=UPI003341C25F